MAAWDPWRLRLRVLRDVTEVGTTTSLLGSEVATPIGIAPAAYQQLAHPDGEAATARVAAQVGALMTVSTLATIALEDVAAAAPDAPRWSSSTCSPTAGSPASWSTVPSRRVTRRWS